MEHVHAAATLGKGILLLTAHYGNWELLAASHTLTIFPLSVVVRPMDDPLMDRVVERFRLRSAVELIAKRQALPEIRDALRRGRMVGILLDQNAARREAVFVPFFGRAASTSKSLALLALRTGAPVVPIFIRREATGGHRVTIAPPLPAPAPSDGDALLELTRRCTETIEAAVHATPEQWLWVHDRWRTRQARGPSP